MYRSYLLHNIERRLRTSNRNLLKRLTKSLPTISHVRCMVTVLRDRRLFLDRFLSINSKPVFYYLKLKEGVSI
ncbi:hypothetical protein [Brochothrix phage ADU4]|nr:hypothetical protein [Brochothrix phage ADU4]